MGKSNKAQRTKGNTRPSSSGHSASLLNSSGKPFSGFVGFNALSKELPSYVPVAGQYAVEDADSSIDSTFRMVMRKMLKRDPTTRLKAVQEFGGHCSEKETEIVKNVLPFWPRLYNKLALDVDRRIREATHEANGKLISKVKRDIAPYLKSIIGTWLLGQCDCYAPAASVAQSTFAVTFPSAKQPEAIMFCKNEIFLFFKDNLFQQTTKTLSEPTLTSEEVENKYTLLTSSTLQAIKLILTQLSQGDRNNIQEDISSIVVEDKFWKYAKNTNTQIRGAWFSLVGALCRDMREVFLNFEQKLSKAVFGCLSEKDPVVASSIWEAVLHNIICFEKCWDGIDIHKMVLPQLWAILKEGGRGNASVIFPCLLPFLCKLPKNIIEAESFNQQFFLLLRQSLFLEKVKLSHTEYDAVIMAFMECLLFSVFQNLNNDTNGYNLAEKTVNEQLLPLITDSFSTDNSHLTTSKFYLLLKTNMNKIEKKQGESQDENTAKVLNNILSLIWDHNHAVFEKMLNEDLKQQITLSATFAYFCHSMNDPSSIIEQKPKNKVRFQDESPEEEICSSTSKAKLEISLNKESLTFKHMLKFCKLLCRKVNDTFEPCLVKLLSQLIADIRCIELFECLLNEFDISYSHKRETPVLFFERIVSTWLKQETIEDLFVSNVVDIIFAICSCVEMKEGLDILNQCCHVNNPALLKEVLSISHASYQDDLLIQEWLKSSVLGDTVVDIFKDMTRILKAHGDPKASHQSSSVILELCLKDWNNVINFNVIEKIVIMLQQTLDQCLKNDVADSNSNFIDFTCNTIATILINHKDCWNLPALDDILVSLFHLIFNSQYTSDKELHATVMFIWEIAINQAVKNGKLLHKDGFICQVSKMIHNRILNLKTFKESAHVLKYASKFLCNIEEAITSSDEIDDGSYQTLLQRILLSIEDWSRLKDGYHLDALPASLEKKIFYPFPTSSIVAPLIDVPRHALVSEIVSSLLVNLMNSSSTFGSKSQIIKELVSQYVVNFLWSFSYCEGSGFLKNENTIEYNVTFQLQKNCFKLVAYLKDYGSVLNKIYDRSVSVGVEWALPLQAVSEIIQILSSGDFPDFYHLIEQANDSESEHRYVTAQVLIHHIPLGDKIDLLKHLSLEIFKMPEPLEENVLLGTLSELCCCIQESNVLQLVDVDWIKEVLLDLFQKKSAIQSKENEATFNIQMMFILSTVAKYTPSVLDSELWQDLIDMLSTSLMKSKMCTEYTKSSHLLLAHQACSLFCVVSFLLSDESELSTSLTESSKSLWKTKSGLMYPNCLHLLFYLAEINGKKSPMPNALENLLTTVCEALENIYPDLLLNILIEKVPQDTARGNKKHEPTIEEINSVLEMLTVHLTSNIHSLQFAAHSMLIKILSLVPALLKEEPKSESGGEDDDDEKIPISLYPLINLLDYTNQIVESMLLDIRIGDPCTVLPFTDSYVFSMAYLLVWIEILELLSASSSQVRSGYVAYLEENKLISSLFSNVYRLMPENPSHCLSKEYSTDTKSKEGCRIVFTNPPQLSSFNSSSLNELKAVACYLYCTALRKMPAAARTWWKNLDRRSSEIVDKFISAYISGILSADEIQSVQDEENFSNLVVVARLGCREVIAKYTIDESTIELSIQLPSNYPLNPIITDIKGKNVLDQQAWKQWQMRLMTALTYQNGSILDGLGMWKRNLDKKFEGVEECTICYYILHTTKLKLPDISCHTCKKKFHRACLYKWFKTSNVYTCPLCRNEF